MPWYRCLVRGENFPGELAGESKPVGFFTNRFVQADDPEDAEWLVVNELKQHPKLAEADNVPGCSPAMIYIDEIESISAAQRPSAEQGFVWFLTTPSDVDDDNETELYKPFFRTATSSSTNEGPDG